MPLRLHAITVADARHETPAEQGDGSDSAISTSFIPFRDLAAIVTEQKNFSLDEPAQHIAESQAIVDAAFRRAAVLPAPVGVMFRAPDVLKHWMELHYVSLSGALEFIEDRMAARVHVVRNDGRHGELESGSDLAAAATEAFRAMRRHAVGSVPLRIEQVTGLTLSTAFLVERDHWKEFLAAVAEQREAHKMLRFDVTGPWAPYDFVHMQFGG